MGSVAQKKAIQNYRARLTQRGFTRFEVIVPVADRELIRSLARCLAEEGLDAEQVRAIVKTAVKRRATKARRHLDPHCAVRLWSEQISIFPVLLKRGVRSTCDALSS